MAEHSQALLTTAKAANYIRQLSKHFAHKIRVEDGEGLIIFHFADGRATAQAEGNHLKLHVDAATIGQHQRVEEIIGSHLERFAFRENLRVHWPDQTEMDI